VQVEGDLEDVTDGRLDSLDRSKRSNARAMASCARSSASLLFPHIRYIAWKSRSYSASKKVLKSAFARRPVTSDILTVLIRD